MKDTNTSKTINLIISPHLDDAVFSLGGLISLEARQTKVITVFGGHPAKPISSNWDKRCGFKNSTQAMEARIRENTEALNQLGLEDKNIINLPYLDRQYRKSVVNNSGMLEDMQYIIEDENDKEINIFVPMLGYHSDHKMVRDLVTEIYFQIKNNKENINLFWYQDMPYFYRFYILKKTQYFFKSKNKVALDLCPEVLNFDRKIIKLNEQDLEKKIIAGEKYKSQFKPKLFGLRGIDSKQRYISTLQAKIFNIGQPHCEIIYQIL